MNIFNTKPSAHPSTKEMATTYDFSIEVAENKRLMEMCGPLNEHLKQIEQRLGICIYNCGEHFKLHGKSLHILRQGEYVL
ncbi:MAG: hypothetical protein OXD32_05605, partial [Endozoicomonadaceae bacterium]|nr:hypothetical protein [Endozoicomonadaceae bacterium]